MLGAASIILGPPCESARQFIMPRRLSLEISELKVELNYNGNSLKVPIVPGDLPCEQDIFHARAGPDIMHYQVTPRRFIPNVHHDPHMILTGPHVPGNNVAGEKRVYVC